MQWVLMAKKCKKIVVYPKSPQFSQKLSASNACMLANFSMSVQSIPLMLCEIPLAQLPFSQSHFNPLYPSYHSNNTHNILCPSTLCAPNEI